MALARSLAALAAATTLVSQVQAWNVELPPCVSPFQPFVYSGCFQDGHPNTLTFRSSLDTQSMTVEKCVAECKGNGYRYAGLEYYGVCFCGQTVNGAQLAESQCSFPCTGNSSQTCGGNDIISVYSDPTFPPSGDVDIDDYVPLGCYSDNSDLGRTLSYPMDNVSGDTLTTESCLSACRAGGYPFAGTEYGGECWCGVVVGNNSAVATPDQCSMPCKGNSSETCGGPGHLSLYVAKELESLEPCGYVPSSSSSVVPPTSTSSVTPPTTTSVYQPPTTTTSVYQPPTTTTSVKPPTTTSVYQPPSTTSKPPGTTTKPPTTTPKPPVTTTTSSALCTSTYTLPPKCEYGCGKWCNQELPDWDDDTTCKKGYSSCKMQVAACFKNAGWPGSMDCFDYAAWCENISGYCGSTCKKGKNCGKKDCFDKKPPKGHTPPVTTTKVYPCPTTSVKTTTKPATTSTTTTCVPEPTNICKQPTNWWYGYGPGNPVGGVELPIVTCNDIKEDWYQNPFKLYTDSNSKKCGSWPRPKVPDACAAACKEQFDDCNDTYVQGCKTYNKKRSYKDFHSASDLERRTFGWFTDNWGYAKTKCKAQYDDCLNENRYINPAGKCGVFGGGW